MSFFRNERTPSPDWEPDALLASDGVGYALSNAPVIPPVATLTAYSPAYGFRQPSREHLGRTTSIPSPGMEAPVTVPAPAPQKRSATVDPIRRGRAPVQH